MNNNSFLKSWNPCEIAQYEFENNDIDNKSYINSGWTYDSCCNNELSAFDFNCCECHEVYDLSELTFKNGKLICECGAKFAPEDLKPGIKTWFNGQDEIKLHNLKNDTFNKVSVPTLINREYFYCPKCRTTHKLEKMPIENKQRLCSCGELYSFDEVKIMNSNDFRFTFGEVYLDNNKITMTYSKYFSSITREGRYYWQDGRQRLTMNLETGFSYMTNTGNCYTMYNDLYRRNHDGKNGPKMFNCTYCGYSNDTLACVAQAKVEMLYNKYRQYDNLIKFMEKKHYTLKQLLFNNMLEKIDEHMTNYYNNKYSYHIPSFKECVDDSRKTDAVRPIKLPNSLINMHDSSLLVTRNRFINLNYHDLKFITSDIVFNIQHTEEKRDYAKLPRETNNIALEYICKSVNASKNLRKKISAYLTEGKGIKYNRLSDNLYSFVNICRHFKNKENVNKIFNTLTDENSKRAYLRYESSDQSMKLWLQYRNETYISNCNIKELEKKLELMDDSVRMINSIRKVFGADWDLNSVKFYNEQQFHDDLVRITTSEDYIYLVNKEKNEQQIKPFEMEKDIYDLEEIENDFYIARNRAMLTNIGSAMGICVGGYGNSVESGRCRIAYLKENGVYKVCIELRGYKNSKTNKYEYTVVQAKMQYNGLVADDSEYYTKVMDWVNRNGLAIDTHDMIVKQSRRNTVLIGE